MTSCPCERCKAIVPPENECPKCASPRPAPGVNGWVHDRSNYVHGNVKAREDIVWIHGLEACTTAEEAAAYRLGGPVGYVPSRTNTREGHWYRLDYLEEVGWHGFEEPS